MTQARSESVALRVYVALRDAATLFCADRITCAEMHASNGLAWRRAERAGRVTVTRVSELLVADLNQNGGVR